MGIFKVLKSVKDFAKAFLIRDVSICCFCSMVTKDALSDAVGKLAVHQKQCKMGAKPRLEVNNHSAGLIQCIPRKSNQSKATFSEIRSVDWMLDMGGQRSKHKNSNVLKRR